MFRVTVDVGGTFTDCLVLEEATGDLSQFKAPTTPSDPSEGLTAALVKAASSFDLELSGFLSKVDLLIHGTTLATNTLINQDGAVTGLITTENFRDVLEIRRGYKNVRTSMYNVFVPPYKPLIPRFLRLEVRERTTYEGEIVTALDEDGVREVAQQLGERDVEAVAVCFLHSYANPANELRAVELSREVLEATYVTSSHEILPVWREWERFSTTVVSAYVGPVVERCLRALEVSLAENGFRGTLFMMLSDGLVETVDNCVSRAVYLIGSGPAAAPAAAIYAGEQAAETNLLSFDMGGTSIDVGVIIDGEVPTTTESWVNDERVAIKMVDVHSAGAGGGSIGWIDSLGLLRVGPQSAGSDPGPACYGLGGTEPTVTDSDVLLGYVDPGYFLGGEIELDAGLAAEAVRRSIAEPLGMDVLGAAQAMLTAVSSFVADRISEVFTSRGLDVRDVVIVAGGGAGPVHAAFIADMLQIPKVIVPTIASTFSAFGMLAMDVGRNYARSYITAAETADVSKVGALFAEMEAEAVVDLEAMGADPADVRFNRTADMRYVGQFSEVEVAFPSGDVTAASINTAVDGFNQRHEELYTFRMDWKEAELLTFHLRATVQRAPFELSVADAAGPGSPEARKSSRQCVFGGRAIDTEIFDGARLRAGDRLNGPAIIEEPATTVVVPPGFCCEVDRFRNYLLTRDDVDSSAGVRSNATTEVGGQDQ